MDQRTLGRFKKHLEEMETELSAAVEHQAEASPPVTLDTSIGRRSRMDAIQSQQMAVGLMAPRAVVNGTYGLCRRQGPIARERLEARPDAVLCVPCAERASR